MITANFHPAGYWVPAYTGRTGHWRVANDALGRPIQCETETLALSVARYRRRRLKLWRN